MSVIRVNKQKSYTTVANQPFNDNRLTWEASGVMGFLLTKPDGWECRPTYLIALRKAGKDKIRRILKELEEYGYLFREKAWDDKGRIYWRTEIYELPSLNPHLTIGGFSADGQPYHGEPYHGEPSDGQPSDGKPLHIVNTNEVSTNKASNDQASIRSSNGSAAAALGILDLLAEAGINEPTRSRLASLDHMTCDYANSHIQQAEKEKITTGLLITRLRHGDPAPKQKGTIPEEYLDIIVR